jgi:aspartate aminotransferase-like enzyme
VDTFNTIIAITALEMALKKFGAQVQHGKGVATAQEILLEVY